jgi:hypothetical protein
MNHVVYLQISICLFAALTAIPASREALGSERPAEADESTNVHYKMHDQGAVTASASDDDADGDLAGLTPSQILARAGLEPLSSCLHFDDRDALTRRKAQWRQVIRDLHRVDPQQVLGWITGQSRPPEAVLREAELQKDCMLTALVLSARQDSNVRLVLSYEDSFSGSVRNARQLATQFESNPRWRRQVLQHLTHSAYRDASSQAHIWHRKFHFAGRSFNIISSEAGERCQIASGQTWKPESTRHSRCWHQQLSPEEREREILTASAAPGISRHHWGTDFDILSLNPHSFVERGPLGPDYVWLATYGLGFGFFQPFKGPTRPDEHNHMEERWHWSYYPIGQAIVEFIADHDEKVDEVLNAQWDALERRWNGRRRDPTPYFPYVRANWRTYVLGVSVP